jgi:signal peptidase I
MTKGRGAGGAEATRRIARDFGGRRGSIRSTAVVENRHPGRFTGRVTGPLMLLLLILTAIVLVAMPQALGWQTYTLPASAMTSTHPAGSFLVVQPAAFSQLRNGDTVTFQLTPGRPEVGVRLITGVGARQDGEQVLITRGANNDVVPVHARQVRGKLLYAVPVVGHLTDAVSTADRNLWFPIAATGLAAQAVLAVILARRRRRAAR